MFLFPVYKEYKLPCLQPRLAHNMIQWRIWEVQQVGWTGTKKLWRQHIVYMVRKAMHIKTLRVCVYICAAEYVFLALRTIVVDVS